MLSSSSPTPPCGHCARSRARYQALSTIPVNLLTVLGFSTATAAAAKGITSGFVQTGKMTKPGALPGEPGKNTGGIFQDDGGSPELAKIQMIGFTIIAIGIFLATVIHQIAIGDVTDGLPNIDASLMVLMGISSGGYLGKKLVTFGTPMLYPPSPETGPPGTTVTLRGSSMGSAPCQPAAHERRAGRRHLVGRLRPVHGAGQRPGRRRGPARRPSSSRYPPPAS